jgi:hypothetical protein
MKVYREDGSFISRAERQYLADERKDKIVRNIALAILAVILLICWLTNTQIYL